MPLSQNVIINFLTKFDKKGLQRATKDLKGFDKFVATARFSLARFAKVSAIAAGTGLTIFAKKSIDAALAQERLDKSLQLTLSSIGKTGLLLQTKEFIENLQDLTNISEDQLTPALQKLIAQTGNLDSAQLLLTRALDISAGTGQEFDLVLNAITKAAVGNFASLGKLSVGLSAAEAKAMGFVEVMQALERFQGDAEESTKTLAGQIRGFRIDAGEATEEVGTGFLQMSSFIAGTKGDLDKFGKSLVTKAKDFADFMVGFGKVSNQKGFFDAVTTGFNDLAKEGNKVRQERILKEKGLFGLSGNVLSALEQQNKVTNKQKNSAAILAKIQADILAKNKKINAEKRAQEALDKKKAQLEAMFDIDRINLQAALTRKLSAEDALRVKLLQQLADGTKAAVDEAQRYADVLKVIEDGKITTAEIDELAKKWGISTTAVLLYLRQLFEANAALRSMLALLDELAKKKFPQPTMGGGGGMFEPGYFIELGQQLVGTKGYAGMSAAEITAERYKESGAARRGIPLFADGGIVTKPTLGMLGEAGSEAVIPLDRIGSMGTKVVVNVQGSVISEGQLQSVIQDVLYNLNRTGAVTQLTNLGR